MKKLETQIATTTKIGVMRDYRMSFKKTMTKSKDWFQHLPKNWLILIISILYYKGKIVSLEIFEKAFKITEAQWDLKVTLKNIMKQSNLFNQMTPISCRTSVSLSLPTPEKSTIAGFTRNRLNRIDNPSFLEVGTCIKKYLITKFTVILERVL